MTKIKHIPLGFPQNITVINTNEDLDNIKSNDYSNKNVHLKLSLTKLQKKNFNKDALEKEIQEATNAARVKVTFVYDLDTNIRSREVAEQTDVISKFKVYADLNSIKYRDEAVDKIQKIQDSMALESFTPHETFTLEYVSIRGAIGIMDGQHKEEMSFDFAHGFDEGIIGIYARTGGGKTTIIENCHPYPCMLSRVGSLKDHFCLKDSHRILIYRSSTGRRYKITMQINGTAKAIGTVYTVVYQDGDKVWEPVKSVDGTHESYVNWVESTFGNKDLFLRTSFYTNAAIKNFPDLSQATKSDKMQLFSTLAGTDFLSVFSDQAKQNIKLIEKDIDDIKGNLKDFDNIEAREEEDKKTIEEDTTLLEEHKANLESDKQSLNEYNELQKAFIQCSATYDIYRQQKSEKTLELDKLHRQVVQSDNNIEGYNQHLADFDQYRSDLKWYEENMALRKELVIKEKNLREKLNNAQAEMDKKESVYNSKKDRYTDIAHIIQNNAKDIEHLSKSIPDLNGKCPVCGAPLETHKKEELKKEVKTINDKIDALKKETAPLEEEYKELGKWIKDNSLQNFKSTLTDLSNQITDVSNDIISIDTYAEDIDIDQVKDLLNNTESKLEEESKRNAELKEAEHKLNLEILDLEDKLNNIPEDYTDKIARITRGIENTQEQIANLNAEISLLKKDLDAIKDSENLRKEIKSKIKGLQEDIKDYELIHQAFGNNGIQALELDSAAPEISDIANSILLETYGDRFQISFDTQRDTKDGRRIDDFVINVFDSENGRMKRLDLISSGEGALIKQTLYYAFSVIRARKTGFCFKTRFLDESDSALDSELRVKYLRMIESAHKQCGAVQTILITHSQELKDIIDQKIEL